MKESMTVSATLAWNLLTEKEREKCLKYYEGGKFIGLHIHAPDGATPKDGPSAGAGITSAIYSVLAN